MLILCKTVSQWEYHENHEIRVALKKKLFFSVAKLLASTTGKEAPINSPTNGSSGQMARRLATNQEIAGSIPAWIVSSFCLRILHSTSTALIMLLVGSMSLFCLFRRLLRSRGRLNMPAAKGNWPETSRLFPFRYARRNGGQFVPKPDATTLHSQVYSLLRNTCILQVCTRTNDGVRDSISTLSRQAAIQDTRSLGTVASRLGSLGVPDRVCSHVALPAARGTCEMHMEYGVNNSLHRGYIRTYGVLLHLCYWIPSGALGIRCVHVYTYCVHTP